LSILGISFKVFSQKGKYSIKENDSKISEFLNLTRAALVFAPPISRPKMYLLTIIIM
jgi:hypothetical protein